MGETRAEEQGGLSLIELLVAMSILIVAMGAIYGIWLGLGRTYEYTQEDIVAQQQARSALGEMVEYIRTVRMPGADVPDVREDEDLQKPIVRAEANSIEIWTDTDRDPSHNLERVTFRVDVETGTLYRDDRDENGTGSSVRLVASNVANDENTPLFSYVDFNGNYLKSVPVDDLWSIREVHVNLVVDIYKGSSPVPHVLGSIIQPRNLRQ